MKLFIPIVALLLGLTLVAGRRTVAERLERSSRYLLGQETSRSLVRLVSLIVIGAFTAFVIILLAVFRH